MLLFARVFYHSHRNESGIKYSEADVLPWLRRSTEVAGISAAAPQMSTSRYRHGASPLPQRLLWGPSFGAKGFCLQIGLPTSLIVGSCCFPVLPFRMAAPGAALPSAWHQCSKDVKGSHTESERSFVAKTPKAQRALSPTSPMPPPICCHQECAEFQGGCRVDWTPSPSGGTGD